MSNDFNFTTTRANSSSYVPVRDNTSHTPSRNQSTITTLTYTNSINPVTTDYSGGDVELIEVTTVDTGADYTNDFTGVWETREGSNDLPEFGAAEELVGLYVHLGFSVDIAREYVSTLTGSEIETKIEEVSERIRFFEENPPIMIGTEAEDFIQQNVAPELVEFEQQAEEREVTEQQQKRNDLINLLIACGFPEVAVREYISGLTDEEVLNAMANPETISSELYDYCSGEIVDFLVLSGLSSEQSQEYVNGITDEQVLEAFINIENQVVYTDQNDWTDEVYSHGVMPDMPAGPYTPEQEAEIAELREQYENRNIYMDYETQILEDNQTKYDLYFQAYASTDQFDVNFDSFSRELYQSYLDTESEEILSYEDWYLKNYVNLFSMFYYSTFTDWKISYYGTDIDHLDDVIEDEELLEIAEDHLEDNEIANFNYIYTTIGAEAAFEYIYWLDDELYRREGEELANEFLADLDGSGSDFWVVGTQAFGEGFVDFFTNIPELITADEQLDPDDYAAMYIMYALQNDDKYMPYLDKVYQIGNSIGNVMPVVLSSTVISLLTPDGGSVMVGGVAVSVDMIQKIPMLLMGLSVAGGSYEQALESGASREDAYLYGAASGVTAVFLEKFLGAMPGMGKNSGFVLNMLKEGGEELFEEFLNSCYQFSILDNDDAFLEYVENMDDVGICALACSAIFSTGSTVINNTVVTVADLEFIATLDNPGAYFSSMLRSDFTGENFGELLQQYDPAMYDSYVEFQNNNGANGDNVNEETIIVQEDSVNSSDVHNSNDQVSSDDFYGPIYEPPVESSGFAQHQQLVTELIANGEFNQELYDSFVELHSADPSIAEEIFNSLSVDEQIELVLLFSSNNNLQLASAYYQIAKEGAKYELQGYIPESTLEVAYLADDYNVNGITDIQAREILFNFENTFYDSDPACIEAIVQGAYEQYRAGNTEPLNLLVRFNYLVTSDPNNRFTIVTQNNPEAYWDSENRVLVLSSSVVQDGQMGTFFHEAGHALWYYMGHEVLPNDFHSILSLAQLTIGSSSQTNASPYLNDFYNYLTEIANQQRQTFDNNIIEEYGSVENYKAQLASDISNHINERFYDQDSYLTYLKSLGFTNSEIIDLGLFAISDPQKIAQLAYDKQRDNYADSYIRDYYPEVGAISDIIGSIFWGKRYDFYGNQLNLYYSHSADYYQQGGYRMVFHEIIANYTVLRQLGDTESLEFLRSIIGDDMMAVLEDTYQSFFGNTNINSTN